MPPVTTPMRRRWSRTARLESVGRTNPRSFDALARPESVRTCVGCRERATKSELIRIVAASNGTTTTVEPDPRRSAGGRGAHLHHTVAGLGVATRGKGWGRAVGGGGPGERQGGVAVVRGGEGKGERRPVAHRSGEGPTAAPSGAVTDRKRSTRS